MTAPQGHGAPWTTQDEEALERLFRGGLSDARIGRALGRTPDAVKQRRLGMDLHRSAAQELPGGPWTQGEEDALRELFETGDSDEAIAEKVQRSRKAVTNKRNELGLHRPQPGAWTPYERRRAAYLRRSGATCREIGEDLGRTTKAIERHLARATA